MKTLHLGVVEIPYAHEPPKRYKKGKKRGRVKSGSVTTGDVAEILEAKYHVMDTFRRSREQKIADEVTNSMQGSLESLLMGAPPVANPLATATTRIEEMFKQFISSGEMEKLGLPGIPTKASLERRSLRFKSKRSKGQRPSFYDTGLYMDNFISWAD